MHARTHASPHQHGTSPDKRKTNGLCCQLLRHVWITVVDPHMPWHMMAWQLYAVAGKKAAGRSGFGSIMFLLPRNKAASGMIQEAHRPKGGQLCGDMI